MHSGKRNRQNRGVYGQTVVSKVKGPAAAGTGGSKSAHKPGLAPPGLPSNPSSTPPHQSEDEKHSMACRDRFLFVMQGLVGQQVEVEMLNGAVYEGVLHTVTPFKDQPCRVVLGAAILKVQSEDDANPFCVPGSTIILEYVDVLQIHTSCMDLGSPDSSKETLGSDFMTDTDISKGRHVRERGIEEVDHSWLAGDDTDGGIEDGGSWQRSSSVPSWQGGKSGGGQWDQFEANERLFNVTSSYDENLYTTKLDKSAISPELERRAEQLAREIEGKKSTNIHMAEERGQVAQSDYTEEELYGGVLRSEDNSSLRKKGNNVYIPPALRAREQSVKEKDAAKPWREINQETPDSWDTEESPAPVADVDDKHPEGQNGHIPQTEPNKSLEENENEKKETSAAKPSAKDQEVVQNIILTLAKKQSEQSQESQKVNKETTDGTASKPQSPVTSKIENLETKKETTDSTKEAAKDEIKETQEEQSSGKPTEKVPEKPVLNPNAKSFSFNPKAKEFKPPVAETENAPQEATPGAPVTTRQPAPLWVPGMGMVAPNQSCSGAALPNTPQANPSYVPAPVPAAPTTAAQPGQPPNPTSQINSYPQQFASGTGTAYPNVPQMAAVQSAMMSAQQMGVSGMYGGVSPAVMGGGSAYQGLSVAQIQQLQNQQQLRHQAVLQAAYQQQAAMAYAAAAQQAQQQAQTQQYLFQQQQQQQQQQQGALATPSQVSSMAPSPQPSYAGSPYPIPATSPDATSPVPSNLQVENGQEQANGPGPAQTN